MNISEVKAYFGQIRKEKYEIIHLRSMIKSAETSLLPSGIRYDKDKVQTSPDDMMSRILSKAMDMQKELEKSLEDLQTRQLDAEIKIQKLKNSDEREVMRYYYMDTENGKPLTWEHVSVKMGYDSRHVRRLHGRALANLAEGGNE